jgi:uncharacterized membrane protein
MVSLATVPSIGKHHVLMLIVEIQLPQHGVFVKLFILPHSPHIERGWAAFFCGFALARVFIFSSAVDK